MIYFKQFLAYIILLYGHFKYHICYPRRPIVGCLDTKIMAIQLLSWVNTFQLINIDFS